MLDGNDRNLEHTLIDLEEQIDHTLDDSFTKAIEDFDRMLNKRFDAFETHFNLLIKNKVIPLLLTSGKYIPDTYKSYRNLEERVEVLEQNYDVLKNVLFSRL